MLISKHLYFREVDFLNDTTEKGNYYRWMNDPEVTKFLESRFRVWHDTDLFDYVRKTIASPSNIFLAIIYEKKHIGNIKLIMNERHRFAEISLVIDKHYWGKGLGTETISFISDYAFKQLNIHKLWAGVYEPNVASIKAFQKAGYVEEGRFKSQYLFEGKYVDDIILGKTVDKNIA